MEERPAASVRILVAHRQALYREGIRQAIAGLAGAEIVGDAADGATALELATASSPDVVICGAALPDMSGLELTRALRIRVPNAGLIVITGADDPDTVYRALKAGASGILPEDAGPGELREMVARVARGEHPLDESLLDRPEMAARVLQDFSTLSDETPQELKPLIAPLSPREIEILDQISRGNSNKQIARNLSISDQTVKNHITSILKKLAVNDRTEAVVFSLRQGWIRIDR